MTKSFWVVFSAAVLAFGGVACAQRLPQGIPPSRWLENNLTFM